MRTKRSVKPLKVITFSRAETKKKMGNHPFSTESSTFASNKVFHENIFSNQLKETITNLISC